MSTKCPVSDHELKAFLAGQDRGGRAADVADLRRLIERVIDTLETEQAASWSDFEKETLDAIGSEVVGKYVDPGSDIPELIRKLRERHRAEVRREQTRRIEAEEQRDTYKRIANMKRKASK